MYEINVKFPRLLPELKKMVNNHEVDIKSALKAQDSATGDDGKPDVDIAIKLAQEMSQMSGAQQKILAKERKSHPEKPIDDVIENAKTGSKVTQIIATVTQDTHTAIQRFAQEENATQDEATVVLIEEALVGRGLIEG